MIDQLFKDFRESSYHDLVMWKHPKVTGPIVGSIFAFWVVFGLFDYTILTFVCRALQLAMIGYFIASKLDHPKIKSEDIVQAAEHFAEHAKPQVINLITNLAKVILWEDTGLSLRVLAGSIGVAMIGNLFSDLTLLFLVTLGVFAGPLFYSKNKDKIDSQLADFKRHVDGAISNIPAPGKSETAAKKTQ